MGNFFTAEEYLDYDYARWVWDTLTTFDQLSAEKKKYAAEFDPWFERFKQDRTAAIREIRTLPKGHPIRKSYDIQMAYEHWQTHYASWFKSRSAPHNPLKGTFDDSLEETRFVRRDWDCEKRYKEGRRKYLSACGAWPDWRSPEDKAKEAKMLIAVPKK